MSQQESEQLQLQESIQNSILELKEFNVSEPIQELAFVPIQMVSRGVQESYLYAFLVDRNTSQGLFIHDPKGNFILGHDFGQCCVQHLMSTPHYDDIFIGLIEVCGNTTNLVKITLDINLDKNITTDPYNEFFIKSIDRTDIKKTIA